MSIIRTIFNDVKDKCKGEWWADLLFIFLYFSLLATLLALFLIRFYR